MIKSNILTTQNVCEMTAVPGGILECVRSRATIALLDDFTASKSIGNYDLSRNIASLPIQIDALNQSITLLFQPLSHEYKNQIMSFKSSYTPLLEFLKTDAFAYEEAGNTRTTLFFSKSDNTLVAFCSIKCSALKLKGHKILSLCPCVEIAALCVDDRYRYMGIGQAIINHTIQQIYSIKKLVGVQLVTLFAVPDAVLFYKKLNFRKLTKGVKIFYSPAHQFCVPMYLPLPNVL